jgi:hypothetical protein
MPNGETRRLPRSRLPDPASVLLEMTLVPRRGAAATAAARAAPGPKYRVLRTLEVDEYDPAIAVADIMSLAAARAAPVDNKFKGKARRAAKLSIASATTEPFDDLNDLIDTLPGHRRMVNLDISTDRNSDRVAEEKRNVRLDAFLYAASVEGDNDYHLIIGRDPRKPPKYFTIEISGLPPSSSPHFDKLNKARKAYFKFFRDGLPGPTYDFYDPPVPIRVEGSLFFDASHATGSRPGPSKLRPNMPVVWEIHPVSKIVFEP